MSYASVVKNGKGWQAAIVIVDDVTSRCFILPRVFMKEEKAMACAVTVHGLLLDQIKTFLRLRKFEES